MDSRGRLGRFLYVFLCLSVLHAWGEPAVQEGPVRVGASLSFSGEFEEPSQMMHEGYRLWVEEVNRSGGLLGRPVELTIVDDRSSPELCEKAYRQFVSEGYDLLLSPYGTPNTLAAAAVTEPAGYVLLAAASSSDEIWNRGHERVFGTYALARRYFIGFLDLLAREGFRSVAVLHEDNAFNNDAAAGALRWAEAFGLEVELIVNLSADTAAAAVDQIRRSQVDGVVICAYPRIGYEVLETMRTEAVRPPGVAATIAPVHPEFGARMGSFAEGIFAPSQWEPDERIPYPGASAFIRAFIARTGGPPSYHAGAAYAACQVLGRAVEAVGSLDQGDIARHVESLDTVSIIGRFKIDGTGRQIGHNPITVQWQDGRKEIVYPRSLQTAPARFVK